MSTTCAPVHARTRAHKHTHAHTNYFVHQNTATSITTLPFHPAPSTATCIRWRPFQCRVHHETHFCPAQIPYSQAHPSPFCPAPSTAACTCRSPPCRALTLSSSTHCHPYHNVIITCALSPSHPAPSAGTCTRWRPLPCRAAPVPAADLHCAAVQPHPPRTGPCPLPCQTDDLALIPVCVCVCAHVCSLILKGPGLVLCCARPMT